MTKENEMRGVEIIKTLQLTLTADEWELYDIPGRDEAAFQLNRGIEEIINDSEIPVLMKMRYCDKILGGFAEYGAADSEGFRMIDDIFEHRYYGDT
jgi:hypothetical protein